MRKASVVLGLAFGDEGKGITTDYLCSKEPADSIVVRFSGGQQAGHNVILDGKQHIHSSFGSGTLRGIPTYISEHCTFYLPNIKREMKALEDKGISEPRLLIHPLAKATTPYDVAFCRMREKIYNHGSCGLGIGTTMNRHSNLNYKLFAVDLKYPALFKEKLKMISICYAGLVPPHLAEVYNKTIEEEMPLFLAMIDNPPFEYAPYSSLVSYENVIFEGSQGIMLDMDHGIFPHVTYANTTSKNALEICQKIDVRPKIYYVTRCYQTRHGNGWMSNDDDIDLINNEHEINKFNEWQTQFRDAELDYDLLNHSIEIDRIYSDGYQANLMVTCIDQRPGFSFDYDKINFPFKTFLTSHSPESKDIVDHGTVKKKLSAA